MNSNTDTSIPQKSLDNPFDSHKCCIDKPARKPEPHKSQEKDPDPSYCIKPTTCTPHTPHSTPSTPHKAVKSSFEEVLHATGKLAYTNVGVSMLPLIREGRDVMIIQKLTRPPKKYDAILYKRPWITGRGAYILHRVIRINANGTLYTRGDNCLDKELVHPENVLGILTSLHRGSRTISCNATNYRLFVRLWCALFPFRLGYRRLRAFVGKCLKPFRMHHKP